MIWTATPDPPIVMALHRALGDDAVSLVPLAKSHREGLRAACAEDDAIWEIYTARWIGDGFDPQFDALVADRARQPYAVIAGGRVAGMTCWIDDAPAHRRVEIGGTFLAPSVRGSGVNDAMKALMIDHAFAIGYHRLEFRIDIRNARSIAAVRKLGAQHEAIMRRERITWTGHIRDTALFALFPEDWADRSSVSQPPFSQPDADFGA